MGRIMLINQLRQAERACHACWTTADDYHVGRHLRALDAFDGFAKDQHKNFATDFHRSPRIKSIH
jgi:hypothetical protein